VRRREEDAAVVGEDELLHVQVLDAEHEHVVETLAGGWIHGIGPAAPVEAEHLPVDEVGGPPVLRELLRRRRHREGELVEVGHRRHRREFATCPPPGKR
jgi:hypothetical protein